LHFSCPNFTGLSPVYAILVPMNIILFAELKDVNTLSMADERAIHIKKILRLKEGDSFIAGVVNKGKGKAAITKMDEKNLEFSFVMEDERSACLYPVTLLVGQVRPICMRRILREAVSLGVERIILCSTDTGEKSYAKANLYTSGEYRSVLLDGAMQSGFCGLSTVEFASSIREAMHLLAPDETRLVLDNVREGVRLASLELQNDPKVVLAIGPERGFSDNERDIFSLHGFVFTSFGKRILRTETACSAALGVLLGRMNLL